MTFVEAIRDGFRLVNRNWQLVLIQISMLFISAIGAFIIVGLPLAIAFIIFGIDLTGLTDVRDVLGMLRGPSDILSKYLGLVLIILTSILLYILVVALLGIYIFGGSIGIIGRSLRDSSLKFHMGVFFGEAKRLFLRLLGFTSVIGVISIIAFFFLAFWEEVLRLWYHSRRLRIPRLPFSSVPSFPLYCSSSLFLSYWGSFQSHCMEWLPCSSKTQDPRNQSGRQHVT